MKAIIFDCDGVLIDSELIYKSTEREFLEKVGLVYEPVEFFRRFMGRSEESFFEEAEKDHHKKHGTPLPADFRVNLLSHQKKRFEQELKAIAGIDAMLHHLSGVTRAVASSSPIESLIRKLDMTGLKPHFGDHIYSASHVKFGKPKPDLFLYAADKIKTDPKDCLVIEDSENGVLAALAAGMTVAGFTGGGHCHALHHESLKNTGAHMIAHNADELHTMLVGMFIPAPDARSSSV